MGLPSILISPPSSPWCCYITHWNDGSLEIAHLTTRNSESASVSGGKPLTPSPPHVTNNGKHVHVQIIHKLDFMQILCHRKERKVGEEGGEGGWEVSEKCGEVLWVLGKVY